MKKLNKKGFTLTEMIVVIAIIGILAAVLIPSVIVFVQRAQKSNDEQLAASMTDTIERYCIENYIDQEDLLGTDIRTILDEHDFNMVPKYSKWTYVYDIFNKKVILVEFNGNVNDGRLNLSNTSPIDPTHIEEDYFLLGEGKSNLEKGITQLCNVEKAEDYDNAVSLLSGTGYADFANNFNPTNTIYINNSGYFTEIEETGSNVKVVYNKSTYHIADINLGSVKLINNFAVSQCIKSIEVTADTQIYTKYTRSSVKKINLNNLKGSGIIELNVDEMIRVNEDGTIKFNFDEYIDGTLKQEIHIEGTSITVKYFNENGLYAYGKKVH